MTRETFCHLVNALTLLLVFLAVAIPASGIVEAVTIP